ncbi:MAG: hypothetical protein ING71_02675 [Rhodocyclaceae bacterium]|nr:hypothetical protein [Rhodocyclaceae bacterium]
MTTYFSSLSKYNRKPGIPLRLSPAQVCLFMVYFANAVRAIDESETKYDGQIPLIPSPVSVKSLHDYVLNSIGRSETTTRAQKIQTNINLWFPKYGTSPSARFAKGSGDDDTGAVSTCIQVLAKALKIIVGNKNSKLFSMLNENWKNVHNYEKYIEQDIYNVIKDELYPNREWHSFKRTNQHTLLRKMDCFLDKLVEIAGRAVFGASLSALKARPSFAPLLGAAINDWVAPSGASDALRSSALLMSVRVSKGFATGTDIDDVRLVRDAIFTFSHEEDEQKDEAATVEQAKDGVFVSGVHRLVYRLRGLPDCKDSDNNWAWWTYEGNSVSLSDGASRPTRRIGIFSQNLPHRNRTSGPAFNARVFTAMMHGHLDIVAMSQERGEHASVTEVVPGAWTAILRRIDFSKWQAEFKHFSVGSNEFPYSKLPFEMQLLHTMTVLALHRQYDWLDSMLRVTGIVGAFNPESASYRPHFECFEKLVSSQHMGEAPPSMFVSPLHVLVERADDEQLSDGDLATYSLFDSKLC